MQLCVIRRQKAPLSYVLVNIQRDFQRRAVSHDAVLREPSTTSVASTSYQSAVSHEADPEQEGPTNRILNMPYTAEPAFEQLQPSVSASAEEPVTSNRSPAKVGARQPTPLRRNTTGAQPTRRRPGSVGSTGTRDSRRSSRERVPQSRVTSMWQCYRQ